MWVEARNGGKRCQACNSTTPRHSRVFDVRGNRIRVAGTQTAIVAYTQLHIRGDGGLVEVDRRPHCWRSNMSFQGQGYKRPVSQHIWIKVRMWWQLMRGSPQRPAIAKWAILRSPFLNFSSNAQSIRQPTSCSIEVLRRHCPSSKLLWLLQWLVMCKTFALVFQLLNTICYSMMEPHLRLQEYGNMRGIESLFESMIAIALPIY